MHTSVNASVSEKHTVSTASPEHTPSIFRAEIGYFSDTLTSTAESIWLHNPNGIIFTAVKSHAFSGPN
jgi:hypothetical protein